MERKPLYKRIYDDIADKIRSGFYQPNERLPSEKQLDLQYQASRTPVRQALTILESDGYIYRLQGKGSFVSQQAAINTWATMTGLRTSYMEKGKGITTHTIECKQVQRPFYAKMLELTPKENLTFLKRVRHHYETPVLYLEHYLHPKLPMDWFTNRTDFSTIHELLASSIYQIVEADEEIESVEAPPEVASILQLEPRSPLLRVMRLSYDQHGMPIDVNVYYVHTKRWKYRVRYIQS